MCQKFEVKLSLYLQKTFALQNPDYTLPAKRNGEMSGKKVNGQEEEKEGEVLLSQGLVNHYGATFLCLANSLEKLNTRQEILTVATQEENEKLNRARAESGLEHMAAVTAEQRNRLVRLKEEMAGLGERSVRLRLRAAKLQEAKQEEAMQREMRKDGERRREEELIAKPAGQSSQ